MKLPDGWQEDPDGAGVAYAGGDPDYAHLCILKWGSLTVFIREDESMTTPGGSGLIKVPFEILEHLYNTACRLRGIHNATT